MEPYRGYAELGWATEILDGDREAEPLIGLHRRRLAARETATRALAEARELLGELEADVHRLDGGLVAVEAMLIERARQLQQTAEASAELPVAVTEGNADLAKQLHDQLKDTISAARRVVRAAADARPPEPIPVEHLQPGFAVNAAFAAPAKGPPMGGAPLPGGGRPGIRNARGVAQAMIAKVERVEKSKSEEVV